MGGFVGLPVIASVAPFLVLPLLARTSGLTAWASLGVGQAVGALASAIVIAGWTLTGPARVAGVDAARRVDSYAESLSGRLVAYVLVAPAAASLAAVLAPKGGEVLAALMALSGALIGLSPAWYAIGIGSPVLIARYEVLPRAVAITLTIPILLLTGFIAIYPVLVALCALVGLVFFSHSAARSPWRAVVDFRRGLCVLWKDRSAIATVFLAGLYSSTPLVIMGAVLPVAALASFSSTDKLYRIGLYGVVAVGNAFQGWVAERHDSSATRRMRLSLATHTILGLGGLVVLAFFGPAVTAVAFGPPLASELGASVFYGVAFLGVSLTTSMGLHILVPLGETRAVLVSTAAGAACGVLAMVLLGTLLGGTGGAAGLALGESVVCVLQAVFLRRVVRRRRREPTGARTTA